QGGEHGKLAARLATQVIKAYVEKQHRMPPKMADQPKPNKVDIGGLWSAPDNDGNADEKADVKEGNNALQGGRFEVDLSKRRPVLATAAPGMQ
ncbi:MAG TPA: hypothetical protein VGG04_17445, partial [Candidatus Sulfotelmatobacter sp.]